MLEAIGFGVVVAFVFVAVLVGLLVMVPVAAGYMDGRRYRERARQAERERREAARVVELPDPEGIETSSLDSDSWNERIKEWNGNQ